MVSITILLIISITTYNATTDFEICLLLLPSSTLCEYVTSLGGLGVICLPRDPRFVGSNPTEVGGFFQDVKILSTSPPGGTLNWGSQV